MTVAYPFTAIVGQDDMKLALSIAAVDPSIGGVLVFGERGTGKSTTIRALAQLLPKIAAVKDCPYQCDPQAPSKSLCAQCQKTPPLKSHKIDFMQETTALQWRTTWAEDKLPKNLIKKRIQNNIDSRFESSN